MISCLYMCEWSFKPSYDSDVHVLTYQGSFSLSVCALVTSSALEMVHKLTDAVKKIE